jgi:hypothetical protein
VPTDVTLRPFGIARRQDHGQDHAMLSLWVDMPWWVKTPISLTLMALGGWLLWGSLQTLKDPLDFGGGAVQRRDFFFGVVSLLTGLVLLATSGRSSAEKHGYKF